MLEKVLSSHVLWYNDEGIYVRTFLESAHVQVKSECAVLTRPINPKAIASECEDLTAGFLHHGLREVLRLTDMFDEFYGDLLYELKCGFPGFKYSAKSYLWVHFPLSTVHLTFALSPPSPRSCSVSSAPRLGHRWQQAQCLWENFGILEV